MRNANKQILALCVSAMLATTYTTAFAATGTIQTNTSQPTVSTSNVMILEKNAFQNQIINGDAMIPESMADQQITLDHVTINGTLYVSGGSSITLQGSHINSIELQKQNVTVNADTISNVGTLLLDKQSHIVGNGYNKIFISNSTIESAIIDAEVQVVEVNVPISLKLYGNADIQALQISEKAENTTINFANNAEVDTCILYGKTKITGSSGKINELTVYVNGVETEIKPEKLFLKQNANKITYTARERKDTTNTTNAASAKERLVLSTNGEGFNASGKAYKNVTIKAQNATLSNAVVNEDITIQDTIKNTSATLKDVTVNGNVNIYGGKENINIQNCTIQKDIISHRSDRLPVTLLFDSATKVDGNVVIRGNTILKGDRYTILKNVLVEQYSGRKLEIDTNIKNINLNTTAVELQLNQNKTIETMRLSSVPNTLKINMAEGSVIDTLYADANIEVTGSGKINKIVSDKNIKLQNTIQTGIVSDTFVSVTDIDIATAKMYTGKSMSLSAIIKPLEATKRAVRWSIKDDGNTGATLQNGNVLTAYNEGTVIVTAQIRNAINNTTAFTKDFAITVENEFKNFVRVQDIVMTSPTIWDIDEPLLLTADVTPSNATNTFVKWTLLDDGGTKASLINNELTARLTGKVTVLATVEKGANGIHDMTKQFEITIIPIEKKFIKVDDIVLNTTNTCKSGEMLQLSGTVQPNNADNKEIQWRVVDAGTTGAYIQNHTNLYTRTPGNIVISATVYGKTTAQTYQKEFIITVK